MNYNVGSGGGDFGTFYADVASLVSSVELTVVIKCAMRNTNFVAIWQPDANAHFDKWGVSGKLEIEHMNCGGVRVRIIITL